MNVTGAMRLQGPHNQISLIKSVEITEAFTSLVLDYQEYSALMTICIIRAIFLPLPASLPPSLVPSLFLSLVLVLQKG